MTTYVKDGGVWKTVNNLYIKESGTWTEVDNGSVRDSGTWKEFHTSERSSTLSSTSSSTRIQSLFSSTDWAASTDKRVIIPAGVEVGMLYVSTADTSAWGGTLTIENNGTISGAAGTAGTSGAGGQGGTALYANMGSTSNLVLENNGIIRGGGGGGGRGGTGGTGGQGHYVTTEGPYNDAPYNSSEGYYYTNIDHGAGTYYWNKANWAETVIKWANVFVAWPNADLGSSYTTGGYTYIRGNARGPVIGPSGGFNGTTYFVSRQYTTVTSGGSGGGGGAGGIGAGYSSSNASGSAGSAGANGSTNAGRGGTGGTGGAGGTWGTAGSTGSTGATGQSGSYSSGSGGSSGSAGGAAGYSVYGYNRFDVQVVGTLTGPTANS